MAGPIQPAVEPDRRDLDELTHLLGQLLHRIDEQVARLAEARTDLDPLGADTAAVGLEHHTRELHALVGRLLAATHGPAAEPRADLEAIVGRCTRALLQDVGHPLVVRQRSHGRLPPVACAPALLERAVQRALMLAAQHAGSGGEVLVASDHRHEVIRLQVQSRGAGSPHLTDRSLTLREFVTSLHGSCSVRVDDDGMLDLALDLPAALELDGR